MSHSPLGLDMPRPRWSHWVSSVPDAFVGEGWAPSPSHLPRPEDSPGASPNPLCRSQRPPSCSRGQIKRSAESCACYNGKQAAITSAEIITHTRLKGRLSWVIKCCISLVMAGKAQVLPITIEITYDRRPSNSCDSETAWTIPGTWNCLNPIQIFFQPFFFSVVARCRLRMLRQFWLHLVPPKMHFKKQNETPASSLLTLLLLSSRPSHVSHTKTQPKPITSLMNICLIQPLILSTAAVFSMPRHVLWKRSFQNQMQFVQLSRVTQAQCVVQEAIIKCSEVPL